MYIYIYSIIVILYSIGLHVLVNKKSIHKAQVKHKTKDYLVRRSLS